MRLEKIGEEYVVWGWDQIRDCMDDIEAIEVLKGFITEKLNAKLVNGNCGDDEAFHIEINGTVYHVCFADPMEVRIMPEVEVMGW